MKFGTVATKDALGTILAHSLSTKSIHIKKGKELDENDLTILLEAGYDTVVVAKLDRDDIHEDHAAQAFASALCPHSQKNNLTLTTPNKGRVNLISQSVGIVQIDKDKIINANLIDPMISVATLANFKQVAVGDLIATVKIISYGVKKTNLEKVCSVGSDAISIAIPRYKSVHLIITQLANRKMSKGIDAIANRAAALGLEFSYDDCVSHDENDISIALSNVEADVILVLTGSATSDYYDIAPSALRKAGGEVKRFGMPVDPGNLMFWGMLGRRPVIGLPGCARSPALNGADWVFSRIVCGHAIMDADFAHMAIGGLLKENAQRPSLRNNKKNPE